jgi:hypothetical protein
MRLSFKLLVLLLTVLVQSSLASPKQKSMQIAFLSDVHLQDIYGTMEGAFKGIKNPVNGKMATIRTMKSQLMSTRLFNENYFAFLAALNDVVRRGVKLVVMPGDFSDDGQPFNLYGLRRILNEYQRKYGLKFFITCGNHDPVRPFVQDGGKPDFMGDQGREQPLMSRSGLFDPSDDAWPAVVTPSVRTLGYDNISAILRDYGFFPLRTFNYWETPFSSYHSPTEYRIDKASSESDLNLRCATMQPGNMKVPDVSYLVEPVNGLWLLAIDANVYAPKEKRSNNNDDPGNYSGSGIGYEQVLLHKRYLCNWILDVAKRAKLLGKTLIAFSHYPMVEFNHGSTQLICEFAGKNKLQTARIPADEVSRFFADAGIQIHFAGHMHLDNTGVYQSPSGNTLCNIQIPSLAAYRPGYKLLTISDGIFHVETVNIDKVPRFNELFPLYITEYNHLVAKNDPKLWNFDILKTRNYHDFARFHLRELVRLRFIPEEFPESFTKGVLTMNGLQIAEIFNLSINKSETLAYTAWTGYDLLQDLFALYNANELALQDINPKRLAIYHRLVNESAKQPLSPMKIRDLKEQLRYTLAIMRRLLDAHPNSSFNFNTKTGTIARENNHLTY